MRAVDRALFTGLRVVVFAAVFFSLAAFCVLLPACFLTHQNGGAPEEAAPQDSASIGAGSAVDSAVQDSAVQDSAVQDATAVDTAIEPAIDAAVEDATATDAAIEDAASGDAHVNDAATALAEQLYGHWMTAGYLGDCINEEIWFSFESPDRATFQYLDNSVCYDVMIYESRSGRFVIENRRELVLRWDELGWHNPPQIGAHEIEQRYPVAISEGREGEPRLHTFVFTPLGDRTWRHSYLELGTTEQGLPLFKDELVLDLRFDRPVPTSGSGALQMTVSVALSQIDPDTGLDYEYSAELYTVPCVYHVYQHEPESGWIYIEFEGYHYSEPGAVEWNEFLEAQEYEQRHPDWVRERLDRQLFVQYYLNPAEPDFLIRQYTTRDYGKTTSPPPRPGL